MKVVPWCVVEYIIDHLSNTEAMYLIKALLEEYIYDERRVNDLLYGMQFLFNDSEHDAPLLKMIEIVEAYVEIENESIADYARCIAHGMRTNLEEGTR
jgi:hypothetical protein